MILTFETPSEHTNEKRAGVNTWSKNQCSDWKLQIQTLNKNKA